MMEGRTEGEEARRGQGRGGEGRGREHKEAREIRKVQR